MAKKSPSIISQIVELLYNEGPMDVKTMCQTIKNPYKSVYTKALELRGMKLATKDAEGIWSLVPGVTPQTLIDGGMDNDEEPTETVEEGESAPRTPQQRTGSGIPLDQRNLFIQHMTDIGVRPKEAIPTIAEIFFAGDIEDLTWLNQILAKDAQGFITPYQRRLMLSWWSNTRKLNFEPEEYGFDREPEEKQKKGSQKEEPTPATKERRLDPGIGWKIEKDKDGEWVAKPGGPMSYEQAVDAARDRQVIAAYSGKEAAAVSDDDDDAEVTVGSRKGGKRQESLMEYMFKKMIDNLVDGKGKGDDEQSATIKLLMERIDNMEKAAQEERFERLEGMIAQIASRDPWEDYNKIEDMKARFGGGNAVITDQSPAVQIIKDTSDKLDKNVGRLVGLVERVALKSDEFNPETTRSPQEREAQAGELLNQVNNRDRSRQLRRDVFGR